MLSLSVFAFATALWLGSHLLARDIRRPALRSAGLGLILYGLALAGALLAEGLPGRGGAVLLRSANALFFLPALPCSGPVPFPICCQTALPSGACTFACGRWLCPSSAWDFCWWPWAQI